MLEDRREELRQQLEPAVGFNVAGVELDVDALDLADLILPGELQSLAALPVAHVREPRADVVRCLPLAVPTAHNVPLVEPLSVDPVR